MYDAVMFGPLPAGVSLSSLWQKWLETRNSSSADIAFPCSRSIRRRLYASSAVAHPSLLALRNFEQSCRLIFEASSAASTARKTSVQISWTARSPLRTAPDEAVKRSALNPWTTENFALSDCVGYAHRTGLRKSNLPGMSVIVSHCQLMNQV